MIYSIVFDNIVTNIEEDIMIKKVWDFIKENVAAIITVVTAMLTVIYAVLRFCMYIYWKGYFTRLNIDTSLMNLNFDNSIFTVVFVSIVLFVVFFFMAWVDEIISDIKKKQKERQIKGIKIIFYIFKDFGKGVFLSLVILSFINVPLVILMVSMSEANSTISNIGVLFILLYIMEMLSIILQRTTVKPHDKKEKSKERAIAIKLIGGLAIVLMILVLIFNSGSSVIDKKTRAQLVENEEYMISYCDGENYVLHKVEYCAEEMVIYKNEQKVVGVEDCEVSIKQVEKIIVRD